MTTNGRRRAIRGCAAMLALVLTAAPVAAQIQQSSGDVMPSAPHRVRVHLTTFPTVGSAGQVADAGRLVSGMLQLQLLQLPIELQVDGVPPACGRASSSGTSTGDSTAGRADFMIEGEVHSAADQFEAHFDVWRCDESARKQVVHELRTIRWRDALDELTIATQTTADKLRDLLPRVRVVVSPFSVSGGTDQTRRAVADIGARRVSEALWETGDLQPVPADSTGDFVVRTAIRLAPATKGGGGRQSVVAQVNISRPGVTTLLASFSVTGTKDSVGQLLNALAPRTVDQLNQVRFSPGFGNVALQTLGTQRLLQLGDSALCLQGTQPCRPNTEAATTAFRTATQRDSNSFDAFARLGYVQFQSGDRAQGIVALQRAAAIAAQGHKSGRPVNDTAEVSVLDRLGEAYAGSANYRGAESAYGTSLRINPLQPTAIAGRARALRELHRGIEAIRLLADAVDNPRIAEVDRRNLAGELGDAIGSIESGAIVDSLSMILPICHRPDLRRPCSSALFKAGQDLYSSNGEITAVATLFREVIRLDVGSAHDLSIANAHVALFYDSNAQIQRDADGLSRWSYPNFNADSMAFYLGRAEQLAMNLNDASHADWLRRLRSAYFFAAGQLDSSYAYAVDANRKYPSDNSAYLAATAMFSGSVRLQEQARATPADSGALRRAVALLEKTSAALAPLVAHRYRDAFDLYRQTNHALRIDRRDVAWDQRSRAALEAVLRSDSTNLDAISTLSYTCVEHLQDYDCGFHWVYERASALGLMNSAGDSLNAAEAAVLVRKYDVGKNLLSAMRDIQENACYTAVRHLYREWIAAANHQTDSANAAHAQSVAAEEQFVRNPTEESCWVFFGAGNRIEQETFADVYKRRLAAMMQAIQNKTLYKEPRGPLS